MVRLPVPVHPFAILLHLIALFCVDAARPINHSVPQASAGSLEANASKQEGEPVSKANGSVQQLGKATSLLDQAQATASRTGWGSRRRQEDKITPSEEEHFGNHFGSGRGGTRGKKDADSDDGHENHDGHEDHEERTLDDDGEPRGGPHPDNHDEKGNDIRRRRRGLFFRKPMKWVKSFWRPRRGKANYTRGRQLGLEVDDGKDDQTEVADDVAGEVYNQDDPGSNGHTEDEGWRTSRTLQHRISSGRNPKPEPGGSTADLMGERALDKADVDMDEVDSLDSTDLDVHKGLMEDELHYGKLATHNVTNAIKQFKGPWRDLQKKANRLTYRAGTWATSDYPVEEYLKKLRTAMELRTRILEKEFNRVKGAVRDNVNEALKQYDAQMAGKGGIDVPGATNVATAAAT